MTDTTKISILSEKCDVRFIFTVICKCKILILFLDYSTQNGGQAGDNTGKLINSTEIGNEGKMFIGGLSKSTTTESLKAYFEG